MEQKAHKHQADELKKLFQDVQQHEIDDHQMDEEQTTREALPKIDVLNLPPRKDVHRSHKSRVKLKFSKPFRRLMFVVLILIIMIIVVLYYSDTSFLSLFI